MAKLFQRSQACKVFFYKTFDQYSERLQPKFTIATPVFKRDKNFFFSLQGTNSFQEHGRDRRGAKGASGPTGRSEGLKDREIG